MKWCFREFEETMDHLQADIDSLESERGELKEKVKIMSKKAFFEGLSKSGGLTSCEFVILVKIFLLMHFTF